MARLVRNHGVYRRAVSGLVIVLGAGAWVFAPVSTAGATGIHHWVPGTYQAFAPGLSAPYSLVLLPNHTVQGSTWSWSVHRHIVTIEGSGGPAMPILCLQHGQPPQCVFNDVSTGPKTAEGIASQQAPGSASVYVGNAFLFSSPFWAVRTGKS
jgi:hypothetical protein